MAQPAQDSFVLNSANGDFKEYKNGDKMTIPLKDDNGVKLGEREAVIRTSKALPPNDTTIVGNGDLIEWVLKIIFDLMDDNNDESIDEAEGIAIGQAMGESEEQAKKSWQAMCKDMDDDGNTTIELAEWLLFYKRSLKDAQLKDVLDMLEAMATTIHQQKEIQNGA